MEKQFIPGDKVIWYKNGEQVRAIVLRITPKRVKIELAGSDGEPKTTYVSAKNLHLLQEDSQEIRQVNPRTLQEFLNKTSFQLNGDEYEQKFGHYLSEKFQNCERFWKVFVVPLTRRMDGYPTRPTTNIQFRQSINPKLDDIATAHYSIFINLVYAQLHLEKRMDSSLEDIYAHLGSVCDLVETVIEKWYLLLLECQGNESLVLSKLSREKFLQMAGEWYDKNYSNFHKHYLSKGKSPPLKLPSRNNLLEEYLGSSRIRKDYKRHSQSIREFRNTVVHDVKIARIIKRGGQTLIPKPTKIQSYKSWRNVATVANNEDKIKKDFAEVYQQSKEDIGTLESLINSLWDRIITEFREEFYSEERSTLRDLFNIEFSQNRPMALYTPERDFDDIEYDISASGSFGTGGTAEFRYRGKRSA